MEQHPRFKKLQDLQNKYNRRLVIEGEVDSFRNILKLAIFKQRCYSEYETFRVHDELNYIFYNEKPEWLHITQHKKNQQSDPKRITS